MGAKEKHRENLLKELGNPELDFPKRKDYPSIIGVSKKTLYRHFTPAELVEIETQASATRRASCCRQRENVLTALLKRAIGYHHKDTHICVIDKKVIATEITKHYPPDKAAAQEFLDRTEGPVKAKLELSGGLDIRTEDLTEEELNAEIDKLSKQTKAPCLASGEENPAE